MIMNTVDEARELQDAFLQVCGEMRGTKKSLQFDEAICEKEGYFKMILNGRASRMVVRNTGTAPVIGSAIKVSLVNPYDFNKRVISDNNCMELSTANGKLLVCPTEILYYEESYEED